MPSEELHRVFTYETRLHIESSDAEILDACADLLSRLERELFADIASGKAPGDLKSTYLTTHQVTARHFNALRVQIEGKIASIQQQQIGQIADLQHKIKGLERTLQRAPAGSRSNKRHQKQRRLFHLKRKLEQLESDRREGVVRLCFGSNRLFRAQFDLAANGYANHAEWLQEWQEARKNSFFLLGSKDENSGNQSCIMSVADNGSLTLNIRLPDALRSGPEKYLAISGIHFRYGHQEILKALASCEKRKALKKLGDGSYKHHGLPLSFRFKRDVKGWRVFVSVPTVKATQSSTDQHGVIGVDVNADHLAMTETDRFGNPVCKRSIPLNTYGKTRHQTLALIGDACATIISHAKTTGKTVVVEKLDFQKKKAALRENGSPKLARMLSSLAYNGIKNGLEAKGWKEGVSVYQVNPAFTSLIGRVKFAKRYGLSIHHAAALVIGRRYLGVSERVPRHLDQIPDGKNGYVALSLPVRNRDKHVWTLWKALQKKLGTVLVAHFRAIKDRSSSLKTALETQIPSLVGAIPAREFANTAA